MNSLRLIAPNLLLISTCILCFEIVATRISSVIFVNDFAFFILSLSILGLGAGGIFSYYFLTGNLAANPGGNKKNRKKSRNKARSELRAQDAPVSIDATDNTHVITKIIPRTLLLLAASLLIFLLLVTRSPVAENPYIYFLLLVLPFFLAGIFYALVFRHFAGQSFKIYAADLTGAAAGALLAIVAISYLSPVNSVLLIAVLISISAFTFLAVLLSNQLKYLSFSVLGVIGLALMLNGSNQFMGTIPIGYFPEKDFHHVYSDPTVRSEIIESRWSIFGRSDLVRHSHQDLVQHLFIDGAAGSQMYRFDGDPSSPDLNLHNHLLAFSSTIPLLFLEEDERESMLVIGPGGGKEVLAGLISGVSEITGVEINADFVGLVKDHGDFNGGIYTDFPNVRIIVGEGRQYVKRPNRSYDLVKMVLPSTQQVQNIENYALSENYLLTVEAMQDYFNILTPEGRLIFTVYNQWELKRLILTAMKALEARGVTPDRAPFHFKVLDDPFAPTLVIKKRIYTPDEIASRLDLIERLPGWMPRVSYMPYVWDQLEDTPVNRFLSDIRGGLVPLDQLIDRQPFNVAPVYDDSPFFYKIERGIPAKFSQLLWTVAIINILVIALPYAMIRARKKGTSGLAKSDVRQPILIFTFLGLGFMILEISLFQKLVLYLGTPTVSLSVLLSSLLVGMGVGSYFGNWVYPEHHHRRLLFIATGIVLLGLPIIFVYPWLLNQMLVYSLVIRAVTTFFLLLPLGLLLGIPFPTTIRIVKDAGMEKIIPWMYGINGTMSVLGSVLAVVLSMTFGFTPAFLVGLVLYACIALLMLPEVFHKPARPVPEAAAGS